MRIGAEAFSNHGSAYSRRMRATMIVLCWVPMKAASEPRVFALRTQACRRQRWMQELFGPRVVFPRSGSLRILSGSSADHGPTPLFARVSLKKVASLPPPKAAALSARVPPNGSSTGAPKRPGLDQSLSIAGFKHQAPWHPPSSARRETEGGKNPMKSS